MSTKKNNSSDTSAKADYSHVIEFDFTDGDATSVKLFGKEYSIADNSFGKYVTNFNMYPDQDEKILTCAKAHSMIILEGVPVEVQKRLSSVLSESYWTSSFSMVNVVPPENFFDIRFYGMSGIRADGICTIMLDSVWSPVLEETWSETDEV